MAPRVLRWRLQQHEDSLGSSSSQDTGSDTDDASIQLERPDTPMEVEDDGRAAGIEGELVDEVRNVDEDIVDELMHTYFLERDHIHNEELGGETEYEQCWNQIAAEARQPLFTGSPCSRLSYILLLSNLAVQYNVPNVFMHKLYGLLARKILPTNNVAPTTRQEAKSVLTTIGMDYHAIHACPNDCILYRGRNHKRTRCPRCKAKRYRQDTLGKAIPIKVSNNGCNMHNFLADTVHILLLPNHILCILTGRWRPGSELEFEMDCMTGSLMVSSHPQTPTYIQV